MKTFSSLLAFLFLLNVTQGLAQELRAKVTIDHKQITDVDPAVFVKMQTDVEEFLNLRKWTTDVFSEEEKINCSVAITINKRSGQGNYSGTIFVLSSRPVYNSAYNTTLLKVLDNHFNFTYDDFSVIEFNENTFRSNLGSVLSYYAYMIIGMDYDSFSENAGTPYFEKAMELVINAQGEEDHKSGWRASENNINRYWLVENLLDSKFENLRSFLKIFHLDIMDGLHKEQLSYRETLYSTLTDMESLKYYANSYVLKTILEIKAEEIFNLSKNLSVDQQKDVKKWMNLLNPTNKKYWNQLGKSKDKQGKTNFDPSKFGESGELGKRGSTSQVRSKSAVKSRTLPN